MWAKVGAVEAAERTGIPATTIRSWASRAGMTEGLEASSLGVRSAVARRKRSLEERRSVLVDKLGELAEMGVDWVAEALASGQADAMSVRDAIGAFTRAIHDLQLLSGGATSRAELADVDDVRRLRDELAERRARKAS